MPAPVDLKLLGVVTKRNAHLRWLIDRVELFADMEDAVRCEEEVKQLKTSLEALDAAFDQYLETLEEDTLQAATKTLDDLFEVIDTSFGEANRVIDKASYMLCEVYSDENPDIACTSWNDEFRISDVAKSYFDYFKLDLFAPYFCPDYDSYSFNVCNRFSLPQFYPESDAVPEVVMYLECPAFELLTHHVSGSTPFSQCVSKKVLCLDNKSRNRPPVTSLEDISGLTGIVHSMTCSSTFAYSERFYVPFVALYYHEKQSISRQGTNSSWSLKDNHTLGMSYYFWFKQKPSVLYLWENVDIAPKFQTFTIIVACIIYGLTNDLFYINFLAHVLSQDETLGHLLAFCTDLCWVVNVYVSMLYQFSYCVSVPVSTWHSIISPGLLKKDFFEQTVSKAHNQP